MSVNLIDFEAPTPPAFGPTAQDKTLESLLLCGSAHSNVTEDESGKGHDPFDMSKCIVH
jgi:hypothetical protein